MYSSVLWPSGYRLRKTFPCFHTWNRFRNFCKFYKDFCCKIALRCSQKKIKGKGALPNYRGCASFLCAWKFLQTLVTFAPPFWHKRDGVPFLEWWNHHRESLKLKIRLIRTIVYMWILLFHWGKSEYFSHWGISEYFCSIGELVNTFVPLEN